MNPEPRADTVSSPCEDYALLDFGGGRRLERMGRWLLDRPAPQAAGIRPRQPRWQPDWIYTGPRAAAGKWQPGSAAAIDHATQHQEVEWALRVDGLTLRLRLADGGQVGLYPEHIRCWQWLRDTLHNAPPATAMLNLFAATGGASLAAATVGAAVTHIDAQPGALALARSNLEPLAARSQRPSARIIREDIKRFVARAQRHGRHYPLIVLDPPSFGRGPKAQTWSLNRDLPDLMRSLASVLGPHPLGLWLSAHAPDWNPPRLRQLIQNSAPGARLRNYTLGVRSIDGRILAGGVAATANWPSASLPPR